MVSIIIALDGDPFPYEGVEHHRCLEHGIISGCPGPDI